LILHKSMQAKVCTHPMVLSLQHQQVATSNWMGVTTSSIVGGQETNENDLIHCFWFQELYPCTLWYAMCPWCVVSFEAFSNNSTTYRGYGELHRYRITRILRVLKCPSDTFLCSYNPHLVSVFITVKMKSIFDFFLFYL
jgi:hypothetical protein